MTVAELYPEPEPERVPPHDLEAETHLLGDLFNLQDRFTEAAEVVGPEDFYAPWNGHVFAALAELHAGGYRTDATGVAGILRRQGLDANVSRLNDLAMRGTGAYRRHARTVAQHALARRTLSALHEAQEALYGWSEPDDVLDDVRTRLADIDDSSDAATSSWSLEEFLALPTSTAPWVIPGLLRTGWRAIVVAEEGAGKSFMSRQFAICAAAGLHPLTRRPIDPQPVLVVDLENPQDVMQANLDQMHRAADAASQMRAPLRVWHRPDGIDLRTRSDRREFVAELNRARPTLVCMGPIYKSYRVKARESDEQVAAEVQAILDDLRTRFGFAFLLEHHAPHGESQSSRNMRPFGSSLWLRWPEFGLALRKPDPRDNMPVGSLKVGRWRGDRVRPNGWPDRLDRGQVWPWDGFYRDGVQEQW